MRIRNSAIKSTRIAQLQSHERHVKLDYRLRSRGLALATLAILIGAVMVFAGLQGYINWVVEAPQTMIAKLTNASPGIVFATIGMFLGFVVFLRKPISLQTGDDGTLPCTSLFHSSDDPPMSDRKVRLAAHIFKAPAL